jgi:hypothetical protein
LFSRTTLARQVPEAGGFGLADAVLDPGVCTVPQFQSGDVGFSPVAVDAAGAVSVRKGVWRRPSTVSKRDRGAPGRGRSRRAMTLDPAG